MTARKNEFEEFGRRIREGLQRKADSVGWKASGRRPAAHGITFEEFGQRIGAKTESARRYARGDTLPSSPEMLERIAAYLGVTVGYLLAGEGGAVKALPVERATLVKGPVREDVMVRIEDEAMRVLCHGVRLFGIGDHVIVSPLRARGGDIVLCRQGDTTSLRCLDDSGPFDRMVPLNAEYPAFDNATRLGVVTQVHAKLDRLG